MRAGRVRAAASARRARNISCRGTPAPDRSSPAALPHALRRGGGGANRSGSMAGFARLRSEQMSAPSAKPTPSTSSDAASPSGTKIPSTPHLPPPPHHHHQPRYAPPRAAPVPLSAHGARVFRPQGSLAPGKVRNARKPARRPCTQGRWADRLKQGRPSGLPPSRRRAEAPGKAPCLSKAGRASADDRPHVLEPGLRARAWVGSASRGCVCVWGGGVPGKSSSRARPAKSDSASRGRGEGEGARGRGARRSCPVPPDSGDQAQEGVPVAWTARGQGRPSRPAELAEVCGHQRRRRGFESCTVRHFHADLPEPAARNNPQNPSFV